MLQYDYTHQAWVVDGKYIGCAHIHAMRPCLGPTCNGLPCCDCYGTLHIGEPVDPNAEVV